RWIIARTSSLEWFGLAETQSLQIQAGDIGLDHPYQVILRHQLLQCGRKQAALLTTFALDVAHKRQCPHRLMEALSSACSQTARFSHSLTRPAFSYCRRQVLANARLTQSGRGVIAAGGLVVEVVG